MGLAQNFFHTEFVSQQALCGSWWSAEPKFLKRPIIKIVALVWVIWLLVY